MKPSQNPAPPVIITPSPHVHCGSTVSKAMRDVLLALLPAVLASLWFFRLQGLTVIIACCLSAVFFEAVCQKVMNRPVTIKDGSALLTGLLLALCLPPALSPLLAAFGGFCAIVIGKQVFGGLGNNIFNPAHIGRAILLDSPCRILWQRRLSRLRSGRQLGNLGGQGRRCGKQRNTARTA